MITHYQTGTTSHNKPLQLVLWLVNRNWTCAINCVFWNVAQKNYPVHSLTSLSFALPLNPGMFEFEVLVQSIIQTRNSRGDWICLWISSNAVSMWSKSLSLYLNLLPQTAKTQLTDLAQLTCFWVRHRFINVYNSPNFLLFILPTSDKVSIYIG